MDALIMDPLLLQIADYVVDAEIHSENAYETAYLALLDSLGCAMMALKVPMCQSLLGSFVPNTVVPRGARVPGTAIETDPIKAAFDIGTCIRWLDYNDTWLAREWGHPSDNLGAILAVGDYVGRNAKISQFKTSQTFTLRDGLEMMIKAYEIQGILALDNAFNEVGLDHVLLVKLASAAVISTWFGFSKTQICDLLSQVFIDGHSLRTYRHAPNTGPRKSWAAGDATSRAVFLAWLIKQGQSGYPQAISAKRWGFSEALFRGKPITLARPLQSYVMENILFKVSFPAEFHAQTAVEAAFRLHDHVLPKLEMIDRIEIKTQAPAIRIIDKTGPLKNYADRDHCLQYMVAMGLLYGNLTADHYSDKTAQDPRIDILRNKMQVTENPQFSQEYLDPDKRSIANSLQVFFKNGTATECVCVDYPLGHKLRRKEALPYLQEKYQKAIEGHFEGEQKDNLLTLWNAREVVEKLPIQEFIQKFVIR